MKFFKITLIVLIAFFISSSVSYAGGGSTSANPTGGFGSASTHNLSQSSGNPTGGFGVQCATCPPPGDPELPPVPVPFDNGAILLIGVGILLGARKIIKSFNAATSIN